MDRMASEDGLPDRVEVLVVGAGPAGSAAAAWAARAGRDVLLTDAAVFPRDKTCGDGLTPRATKELELLGLGGWLRAHTVNHGLRMTGFGREALLPWPGGSFPSYGSAVARTELDDKLRETAVKSGATMVDGTKALEVVRAGERVSGVTFETATGPRTVGCDVLVVADGVRSPIGKQLGRVWHRRFAYGTAARAYIRSGRSDDQWITSHLELRDADGALVPGYGWVFPLGNGEVNIGVGSLATERRPSHVALKSLLRHYTSQRYAEWQFEGEPRAVASALLPMGGAVSNVAGRNWVLVGDAAGCVNPLNGEGIDYGLEGGHMLAGILDADDFTHLWPQLLRDRYGRTFSVARRIAGLATHPRMVPTGGPPVMRSKFLQRTAVRVMGNLVTDEDVDLTARAWRTAGRLSMRADDPAPFA
ncbi:geranylgeranyl reductase family protein [Nocardia farcinica]|uniref:Geranylgeranyl reductase family n=1 Tax=Nocardia farcinica TaxID=37329 RepID=A0A0H5P449_NOCFR|nr:geranylgeranyl reductase family protein [Nocardia farcinica]AXK87607.1 geranylgeranyl reductase family protein [Nocardia farcinica]MBF6252789.1 geranylgeranyl reductase family protein [Nocardia farcinica]MBF6264471.1 geranylgeranyl reductase family protein [Nocardia farcinica]MBF6283256.1 geranylgeranyl reductase family protein [Nocardia farcinica]MBF6292781.1 geranylgeranyl reductase family protein [Nocardia farcinica]